jgi:hypothetical protein
VRTKNHTVSSCAPVHPGIFSYNPGVKNYYDALGVAHNATPAVVKIAYEGKVKRLAALSEAEKTVEKKVLDEAFAILSNPAKKAWYDARLEEHHDKAEDGSSSARKPLAIGLAVAAIVLGGSAYYMSERSKERERVHLEEERIALEREKARRQAELEELRLKDAQASRQENLDYRRAREAQYRSDRERMEWERAVRAQESRANSDAARQRATETMEARQKAMEEERQRRAADYDQRKAQAEVERQKRWLAEREREEERARTERYNRVQREAAEARAREAAESRRR